jgi:hypothetical protein
MTAWSSGWDMGAFSLGKQGVKQNIEGQGLLWVLEVANI